MVKARQQYGRLTASRIPPRLPHPAGHTAVMALRFTVQGDDEAETAAGLQLLLSLGLREKLPPTDMISNGWMARAVPARTAKAPADEPTT